MLPSQQEIAKSGSLLMILRVYTPTQERKFQSFPNFKNPQTMKFIKSNPTLLFAHDIMFLYLFFSAKTFIFSKN
jgi:hypothetical protein